MKNRYLFALLFFTLSNVLQAQIDTFDIGQFILPEVSRKSLDFSGILGGSVSNQTAFINTGDRVSQNLVGNLLYNNFESDLKHQKVTSGNLYLAGNYQNAAFDQSGQAIQNMVRNSASAGLNRMNRNYYQKNRFYGSHTNLNIYNNFESAEYNGNIRYYENRLQASINLPITYGFGRIEQVSDAWHAIRILQDFERLDLLNREPDYEDIYDLAETLSDLRYDRIFENRIGRIRRLNNLDSHIRKAGFVNKYEAPYFTSLYDIYEFGLQTQRFSGERLTLGFGPEVSIYHSVDSDDSYLNLDYGMMFLVDYNFNYPINLDWQLDISASVEGKYLWDNNPQVLNDGFSVRPELSVKTGFYPNTRTFYTATLTAGGAYGTNSILNDKFAFYSRLSGNMYYFFSPRTALGLTVRFDYSQSMIAFSPTFPGIGFEGYHFGYTLQLKHALY